MSVELLPSHPYRIRVRSYTLVQGERQYLSEWFKGFDSAMAAVTYWDRTRRLANMEVHATRPDAKGGRAWVTLQGLRAAARKEMGR